MVVLEYRVYSNVVYWRASQEIYSAWHKCNGWLNTLNRLRSLTLVLHNIYIIASLGVTACSVVSITADMMSITPHAAVKHQWCVQKAWREKHLSREILERAGKEITEKEIKGAFTNKSQGNMRIGIVKKQKKLTKM